MYEKNLQCGCNDAASVSISQKVRFDSEASFGSSAMVKSHYMSPLEHQLHQYENLQQAVDCENVSCFS
jgi:hypothetical protein